MPIKKSLSYLFYVDGKGNPSSLCIHTVPMLANLLLQLEVQLTSSSGREAWVCSMQRACTALSCGCFKRHNHSQFEPHMLSTSSVDVKEMQTNISELPVNVKICFKAWANCCDNQQGVKIRAYWITTFGADKNVIFLQLLHFLISVYLIGLWKLSNWHGKAETSKYMNKMK